MTSRLLLQRFDVWRATGDPLVLASVYETAGSTYSKAGAQMLINAAGDFHGMLSGGCLEGDLAERARAVLRTGQAQSVTYDLGSDDEELWGLGVGCDGLMRIFLMPLVAANDYQPFTAIATALSGDVREVAATVLESGDNEVPPATALVTDGDDVAWNGFADSRRPAVLKACQEVRSRGASHCADLLLGGAHLRVLFTVLTPPPRILILGGGLDAPPVVRLASELGWRVTVQDHRPAYIANGDFGGAERVTCKSLEEFAEQFELNSYDGAVVMSHHLDTDRHYLRLLAGSSVRYIGLLGPPQRRQRLLEDLGSLAESLSARLHGPAGLDIGGRGPASIALSIIAEMHAVLCGPAGSGPADQA